MLVGDWSAPLRFLTVTHFFENHGGGIERVAGQVCRRLAEAGHQVEWAASAADVPPDDPAILNLSLNCINPIERLTGLPMPVPGPRGLIALSRAIKRADAVIIHDALYVTSIAALLLARRMRKPVILIQHIAGIEFASVLMRKVMRLANRVVTRPMLGAADHVIFISDTVRSAFASVKFRQLPKLVFNGVDQAIFCPENLLPVDTTRQEFGLPSTGKLVIFVGRFVEKKGLAVLREVCRARPDVNFALVGTGPINPSFWGLSNVHVLGVLPPRSVAALYRASDVLLLPSVGEGYPLVIQEALACGLPVICGEESTRADPAATRWLCGVVIDLAAPELTAEGIVTQVDKLELSPEERYMMACYAANAYTWSGMAQTLAALASAARG